MFDVNNRSISEQKRSIHKITSRKAASVKMLLLMVNFKKFKYGPDSNGTEFKYSQ